MRARFISPGAYSPWLGRPVPTEEDRAEAERIVAERCEHYCPVKRAERVESMARIVMQSRIEAEHRALHPKLEDEAA